MYQRIASVEVDYAGVFWQGLLLAWESQSSLNRGPRVHVKVVQKTLGHKSAAMTLDTYADLFDNDLHDVSERTNERAADHASTALISHAMTA